MNTDQLMKLAIVGGILFAAHKYGPAPVKIAAVAIAGVAVARRLPYVSEVV